MPARLIDGRAAALELRSRIAQEVVRFRAAAGRAPGLATVLVGEDPASAVYVRSKGKATREAGMESASHQLPADVGEARLLAMVAQSNADPGIDGILVQLPLPGHIFLHTEHCQGFDADGFPHDLLDLPLLFEGYAEDSLMLRRVTVDSIEYESQIEDLFSDPAIRFINIRNAEAGCYIARIDPK
jgi:hypothetical protein